MKRHRMLPHPLRALGPGALGLTLLSQTACPTASGKLGDLESGGDSDTEGAETDGATSGVDPSATGGMQETGDDGGSGDSTGEPPNEGCEGQIDVPPSIARVMDARRWSHAVEDLLGITPPPVELSPSSNGTEFDIVPLTQAATGQLVGAAMQAAAMLPDGYVPCASDEDTCLAEFTAPLASRAWRRPATDDEVATLVGLSTGLDYDERVRTIAADILQHPDFYVITEIGTPDPEDPTRLVIDGRSIATRMARLIWNSIPDDELLALAVTGQLSDPAVRRQEAQRMLSAPRAATAVADFTEMWLRLDELSEASKDAMVFPEFDAALADAMREEARRFSVAVIVDGDGLWETLTSSTTTYVNAGLATSIYGSDIIGATPVGEAFEAVQLDPARREGLFTLSGPMAAWSNPGGVGVSTRGLALLEVAFCQGYLVPPPPGGAPNELPEVPADGRHAYYDSVFADPTCDGCHYVFDPLTWGLDNYDAIGRYQTSLQPNGDPAGANPVPVEAWEDGPLWTYDSREDYLEQVTTHDAVRECVIEQRVAFAFDRAPGSEDECWIRSLRNVFDDSGGHIPTVVEEIVAHSAFTLVRPS